VLHLYETFGWFRQKEYIKLHFAETWNELHHLLIMESLGGSDRFADRFVAQHIAFFYYWLVIAVYMTSPAIAYDLNKHVENHAFNTYDEFLREHEEELKLQPAPQVAIDYYQDGDLALFDAFQNDAFDVAMKLKTKNEVSTPPRRPVVNNLYDVFFNIRADEGEHAITMGKLQRDVSRRVMNGENSV
jgi:ubiquinol oxidase